MDNGRRHVEDGCPLLADVGIDSGEKDVRSSFHFETFRRTRIHVPTFVDDLKQRLVHSDFVLWSLLIPTVTKINVPSACSIPMRDCATGEVETPITATPTCLASEPI